MTVPGACAYERLAASDLYVVITEACCAGRSSDEVLCAVLDAGVRLVQLREKALADRALFQRAVRFREMTAQAGALLIVDDRLDVALAVGADGVHLGQDDLPVAAARAAAPDMIIGASTHSREEAVAAEKAGATYINIGPIFPTKTKSVACGPLGPDAIGPIAGAVSVPWTVMGGITITNVDDVLSRGARHVAVVTAVTAAADVSAAARALRERMHAARGA
jgi:thiamine-phosphate pyrophosphorylase